MSHQAYEAFVLHGPHLGVKSFFEFETTCWPELQQFYEDKQQQQQQQQTISDPLEKIATPEAKLVKIRKHHLSASLMMLARDLCTMSSQEQNKKMNNPKFLQNYVGEACEKSFYGQPISNVLNKVGVQDVHGFQQACINQISTVLRKNWVEYYGKTYGSFNQNKFERFFKKRFARAMDASAVTVAASSPTSRPSTPASPVVESESYTLELSDIAPLEPSTVQGGSHWERHGDKKHKNKPRYYESGISAEAEKADPFEKNLITWSDLYGVPEALLAGTDGFRHRLSEHQLEESIPYENRFTEWTRRQKEKAKERYHKNHPHADTKKSRKAYKKARKEAMRQPTRPMTPPSPGGPPGTMPRDQEDGAMGSPIAPFQSMIECYDHHGKKKHNKRRSSFSEEQPARFMSFEEMARETAAAVSSSSSSSSFPAAAARLVPFAELATPAVSNTPSSNTQFSQRALISFLEEHGAELEGHSLVFLAPTDKRLSQNAAQFSSLQRSTIAQKNLVAAHLFYSSEQVRGSTLKPVFKQAAPVVVSPNLELITPQGLGATLSDSVSSRLAAQHNIKVLVLEHDSLLSMSQ